MNSRTQRFRLIVFTTVGLGLSGLLCADDENVPLAKREGDASTQVADPYRKFAGKKAGQETDSNGLKMKFVWCLPGSFAMGPIQVVGGKLVNENQDRKRDRGDTPADDDEQNQQKETRVFLFRRFWLGKYEVTQGQWKQIMGTEPWKGQSFVNDGDDYPATYISWDDATAFCTNLTERERKAGRLPSNCEYTLPTEAQWERACRARSETRYSFGDDESKLGEYAWYEGNVDRVNDFFPRRVGLKKPNHWGLCDMHGNVWEWCRDIYTEKLPGGRDPEVARESMNRKDRVIRGGSWGNKAEGCRSSSRHWFDPAQRYRGIGFRLAWNLTENKGTDDAEVNRFRDQPK